MIKISVLVAILYTSSVFASDDNSITSGTRSCPGGFAHGDQTNVGQYWYECQDGQRIPKGCLTEDGKRVEIDETFDTQSFRMKCVRNGEDFLSMIYVSCVHQGTARDVGSQWDDGNAYYTCIKEGNNVRVEMLGCVDQGKPMKFSERVAKGDFIYQCRKSADGATTMNKVGCVRDGKKYNIGETFDGTDVWYTCTDTGAQVIGCMVDSRRLKDGDQFTKNEMMFTCHVHADSVSIDAYACMARSETGALVDRKIGCNWIEGTGSELVEYTCKEDSSHNAVKVQTRCVYNKPETGTIKLDPGCYQIAVDLAVGCVQDNDILKIRTASADQADSLGLRKCQ